MIVIMQTGATPDQIQAVANKGKEFDFQVHTINGETQSIVHFIGLETSKLKSTDVFAAMDGVANVQRIKVPFKQASREVRLEPSVIKINDNVSIGGKNNELIVMSGPCSVESEEGIMITAKAVKKAGANILRGGAYKPRTAPRTFEGLGEKGLKLLQLAKEETGLPIITELMDVRHLDAVAEVADILQIGARNMQNFTLLDEVGKSKRPVMLKRGMSATIQEWLLAAERILHNGNKNVILCERGVRTFDNQYTRNVLDLAAIPAAKALTHLPIISDPSHGTGKRHLVREMAMASIMAGADGLMIETHPDPANALSDGPQSLTFEQFEDLMDELQQVHQLKQKLG